MAEDLCQKDVVGLVFGLELLATHGAVGAAEDFRVVLRAVDLSRELNQTAARRVPKDAPISFIRRRWRPYVFEAEGINRRFYELCVLAIGCC